MDSQKLSYSPLEAEGLELLSQSGVALSEEQRAALAKNGFVICRDQRYDNFVEGYAALFKADLPVFISADALLHPLHWTFSKILSDFESTAFLPSFSLILKALREQISSGVASHWGMLQELDVYTTVALRLCLGEQPGPDEEGPVEDLDAVTGYSVMRSPIVSTKPVFLDNYQRVNALLEKIHAASGVEDLSLFGLARSFDFSLCTARGAYENPDSTSYFRMISWLRFADFRICYLDSIGDWKLSRSSLYAALALRELFTERARRLWEQFASMISSLIGPFDGMTLPALDALYVWLGSPTCEALAATEDGTLLQKILDFPQGRQRITSDVLTAPTEKRTHETPLHVVFSLVSGVYSVESHVLSKLVYNHVGGGTIRRMMPSPLDVGFAVFQNEQAKGLLSEELAKYPYEKDLLEARDFAAKEQHKSLRGYWIRALKSLSPKQEAKSPAVAKTEAFAKRLLQTQLASWAELRHDTILYDKQSRSFGIICSFPDVYVEPNPEFFAALEDYARFGSSMGWSSYFDSLLEVSGELKKIALQQQRGERPTEEQLRFVNKMLFMKEQEMCRPREADGWLISLYARKSDWAKALPVIADIHTADTNEQGNAAGRVLHIATGDPRLMVLTVEGPRAFFGLSSSYFELTTDHYDRVSDSEWHQMLYETIQSPPAWLQEISIGEQRETLNDEHKKRSLAEYVASATRHAFVVSEEGTFLAEATRENLLGLRVERDILDLKDQSILLKAQRKITERVVEKILKEEIEISLSVKAIPEFWLFSETGERDPEEMVRVTPELLQRLSSQPGRKVYFFC